MQIFRLGFVLLLVLTELLLKIALGSVLFYANISPIV